MEAVLVTARSSTGW